MKIYMVILGFYLSALVYGQDTITLSGDFIEDAYINSILYEPDSTETSLIGADWVYHGEYGYSRSLIQFDLSAIPAYSSINQAKLSLFHDPTSEHDGHSNMGGDNSWMIMRAAEEWEAHEATWFNQPITSNTNWNILDAPITDDLDYPDIDVTKMIQDMVNCPDMQHGFMLKLLEENSVYRSVVFGSVDHPDPDIRPILFIEYGHNPNISQVLSVKPGQEKGKDVYINLVDDTPEGDQSSLVASVWTHGGEPGKGRSLLELKLPELPGDKEIYRAELNLYHNPNSGHQGHSTIGGLNNMLIQRIIESWDEHTVHWSNQPETTSEHEVLVNPSNLDNQHYLQIDVTALLTDMIENPGESFGFMIRLEDEETMYRSVVFSSSDHVDSTLWPRLDIYYGYIASKPQNTSSTFDYKVYPNPGNGFFILRLGSIAVDCVQVLIYDQFGRLINDTYVYSQSTEFDYREMPVGIYFIQVRTKVGNLVKKFIKYK